MSIDKYVTLSQATEGMLVYKKASGKSPNTIADYRTQLKKLQMFFPDDPPLASVTRDQLINFLAWLHDGYISKSLGCIPRPPTRLSPKSILNIHTCLSALWSWAVEVGLVEKNIVRTIEPPEITDPVIEPLAQEQITAILKACEYSAAWGNRPTTANRRPTADRDRAIVLLLLDTGLRASELCNIRISDVNLGSNNIRVLGKGNKERVVYFGKRTSKALWKYTVPRLSDGKSFLFVAGGDDDPRQMNRCVLNKLLRRIGERAGVTNVYPHRFRHTFAITYLRNGGDVFTLQELLGHSDLKMVRRYAHIAQTDCESAHKKASPVDNWKL
jgi:integrase/recombinase XerD